MNRSTTGKERRGAVTVSAKRVDLKGSGKIPKAEQLAINQEIIQILETTAHNLDGDIAWRLNQAREVLEAHRLPTTVPEIEHESDEDKWVVRYARLVVWDAHNIQRFRNNPELVARCAIDLGAHFALMIASEQAQGQQSSARSARTIKVDKRRDALEACATEIFGEDFERPLSLLDWKRLQQAFPAWYEKHTGDKLTNWKSTNTRRRDAKECRLY